MSLATIQNLKDFITATGVTLPASCTDEILQDWLDAASTEIQCVSYCGQPLEQQSRTYKFTGLGWEQKLLPFHPVTALSALEEYVDGAWIAIAGANYFLDDADGVYRVVLDGTYGWFIEGRRYRCTITIGYAADAIPKDIVQICVEMAALSFYDSPHSAGGPRFLLLSKITSASTSETYDRTRLRQAWKERLRHYTISPGF